MTKERIYVSTTSARPPRIFGKLDIDFITEKKIDETDIMYVLTSSFSKIQNIQIVGNSVVFDLSGKEIYVQSVREPFKETSRWLLVFYVQEENEFRISDTGNFYSEIEVSDAGQYFAKNFLKFSLSQQEIEKLRPKEFLLNVKKGDKLRQNKYYRDEATSHYTLTEMREIEYKLNYKLFVIVQKLAIGVSQGSVEW
jgi:hypothetical protein